MVHICFNPATLPRCPSLRGAPQESSACACLGSGCPTRAHPDPPRHLLFQAPQDSSVCIRFSFSCPRSVSPVQRAPGLMWFVFTLATTSLPGGLLRRMSQDPSACAPPHIQQSHQSSPGTEHPSNPWMAPHLVSSHLARLPSTGRAPGH